MLIFKKNDISQFEGLGYEAVIYCEQSRKYAGLIKLISTVAIAYDLDVMGYRERYCFRNYHRALDELNAWHARKFNDERPMGWLACRSVSGRDLKQSMVNYHGSDYGNTMRDYLNSLGHGDDLMVDINQAARALEIEFEDAEHLLAYLKTIGEFR